MARHMTFMALALMMLGLVACGATGGDTAGDDSGGFATSGSGNGAGRESVADEADASPGENDEGAQAEAPAAGQDSSPVLPQVEGRRIILSTSLTLDVADVPVTFNRVQSAVVLQGGFVQESDLRMRTNSDGDDTSFAFITVRVPVDRRDAFLADLRGLEGVTVRGEQSSAEEVTAEYVDLQSRLRNLERIEQQYLDLLADATRIDDILTVTDRIDGVRLQIEQIEGRLAVLDDLADLATISIEMQHADTEALLVTEPSETSVKTVFTDAWETAAEAGTRVLYGVVIVGVAAIWLVPIAAGLVLIAWVARHLPRSRRTDASGTP